MISRTEDGAVRAPGAELGARAARPAASRTAGELATDQGKTAIADTVVAKIAGIATREVPGVFAMGAGISRTFGAVRERLPGVAGPAVTQGVTVEVGERQAAVDLDVIVEYGASIPDLAAEVRGNVITAVERMCGLEVTEVNITVGDVHLFDDETVEVVVEQRVQ